MIYNMYTYIYIYMCVYIYIYISAVDKGYIRRTPGQILTRPGRETFAVYPDVKKVPSVRKGTCVFHMFPLLYTLLVLISEIKKTAHICIGISFHPSPRAHTSKIVRTVKFLVGKHDVYCTSMCLEIYRGAVLF